MTVGLGGCLAFFIRGVIVICGLSSAAQAYDLLSTKDFLKAELSGLKLSREKFDLSKEQIQNMEKLAPNAKDKDFTFYFGRSQAGELTKSCLVVPQNGKEGPMTLGLCFDRLGLLDQIKILSHVEEKGRAIEENSFLKQFLAKSVDSPFQVGQDIQGITGASYSSKAVSEAIRKASYAYKAFVKGRR